MMDELVNIEDVDVDRTILVVDAMTGQDAVNVAGKLMTSRRRWRDLNETWMVIHEAVPSVIDRAVTGNWILYVGMGGEAL